MMTEARRTRGAKSHVSDQEISDLYDQLGNYSAVGRKVGLTPQAISLRMKAIREKQEDRARYILPWAVRVEHSQGWVYRAAKAYAKWRRADAISPRELAEARELEEFLASQDAVLTYDYNRGFAIRNRRAGDRPGILS